MAITRASRSGIFLLTDAAFADTGKAVTYASGDMRGICGGATVVGDSFVLHERFQLPGGTDVVPLLLHQSAHAVGRGTRTPWRTCVLLSRTSLDAPRLLVHSLSCRICRQSAIRALHIVQTPELAEKTRQCFLKNLNVCLGGRRAINAFVCPGRLQGNVRASLLNKRSPVRDSIFHAFVWSQWESAFSACAFGVDRNIGKPCSAPSRRCGGMAFGNATRQRGWREARGNVHPAFLARRRSAQAIEAPSPPHTLGNLPRLSMTAYLLRLNILSKPTVRSTRQHNIT